MLRALKTAFFLRYPVPGLGGVPFNLIGLGALALLGLGNPGFWFAGAGLETLYLATLASSARFQRYALGLSLTEQVEDVDAKRRGLLAQLPPEDQRLVEQLKAKCARVEALWRSHDEPLLSANDRALRELRWAYLKLLIARQHVREGNPGSDASQVDTDMRRLELEVGDPQLSDGARASKTATIELLRKRAANVGRRRQSLDEINSAIARVEAQVDLALENAALDGRPQEVSADLDLASRLLEVSDFGTSAADVAALDAVYTARPQPRARVSE